MRPMWPDVDRVFEVGLGRDGVENSDTIQDALDEVYAARGDTTFCLVFPPGRFPLERQILLFCGWVEVFGRVHPKWIRSIQLFGQGTTLVWSTEDCGVRIENQTSSGFTCSIHGFSLVHSGSIDVGIGLHLLGMRCSQCTDLSIRGFGTGLQIESNNVLFPSRTITNKTNGVVDEPKEDPPPPIVTFPCPYNTIHLLGMYDNLVGVRFLTGDPILDHKPWANANTIRGGRWEGRRGRSSRHVVLQGCSASNRFEGCRFDGSPGHAVELGLAETFDLLGVSFRSCTFEGSSSGSTFLIHDEGGRFALHYGLLNLIGCDVRDRQLCGTTSGRPPSLRCLAMGTHFDVLYLEPRPWGCWTGGDPMREVRTRLPGSHYDDGTVGSRG